MTRSAIALVLSLAACSTATTTPVDPLQALQGRWKSSGSKVYYSDGTSVDQVIACWSEFLGERSITECRTSRGTQRMVRANRALGSGSFESQIVADPSAPQNVGRSSRIDYRIEGNTLTTTAHPAAPQNPTARYPVKIEATWLRELTPGR